MSFPFLEEVFDGVRRRTFATDVDADELVWHRDAEDRIVVVVEASGWHLQLDDRLPEELIPGNRHKIEAGTWHRVIRAKDAGKLLVDIIVNGHEDEDK